MHVTGIKIIKKKLAIYFFSLYHHLMLNRDFVETKHILSASLLPSLRAAHRQSSEAIEIASGWFSKAKTVI